MDDVPNAKDVSRPTQLKPLMCSRYPESTRYPRNLQGPKPLPFAPCSCIACHSRLCRVTASSMRGMPSAHSCTPSAAGGGSSQDGAEAGAANPAHAQAAHASPLPKPMRRAPPFFTAHTASGRPDADMHGSPGPARRPCP